MNSNFYIAFEDKFRGNPALIKNRLQCYLPFILPLKKLNSEATVIDLGCGRGEWLELLKEQGFIAVGVELDEFMLNVCKERKLNVQFDDAIGFLKKLPDQSQTIVTAFHLVEHLPFDDLQILVQEALRVLKPAGLLIMETPNPENIYVAGCSFYLDPTHQRPLPADLLAFLPEYYGFAKIKVLRLQEPSDLRKRKQLQLIDVLKGVSPDYAVIAQKTAENEFLGLNEEAFTVDYGVTLDYLALAYNEQAEMRARDAEIKAEHVAMKAREVAFRAERTQMKVQDIQSTAERAEIRAREAESKSERTELRVLEIESKAERAEMKAIEVESKAECAEIQAREVGSQREHIVRRVNEVESKAEQAEIRAQEAETKAQQFEIKAKETEYKLEYLLSLTNSLEAAKICNYELDALLEQKNVELTEAQALLSRLQAHADWLQQVNHELNSRAEAAEFRVQQGENNIAAIKASVSWRIGAPLRGLSRLVKTIYSTLVNLFEKITTNLKLLLAHSLLYIKRRPHLKRLALRLANYYPQIKARLVDASVVNQPPGMELKNRAAMDNSNLNYRTKKIYSQLKMTIENCHKDY